MTLVEGTQICIPPAGPLAGAIIKAMQKLLEQRYHGLVGRKTFLGRWSKLRKALFLTQEYQDFREEVIRRCNGVCEQCCVGIVEHVHHIKRVAMYPQYALILSNVQGLCRRCHTTLHRPPRARSTA